MAPVDRYYIVGEAGIVRGLACPNGDWDAEFFIPFCLEAIDRFTPSAIWFDGTRTRLCYCDRCKAAFKEEHGFDLTPPANVNERARIAAFSEKSFVNCMKRIRTALKERDPHILINFANAPDHYYLRDAREFSDYASSDGANGSNLKRVQYEGAYRSTCGVPSDLMIGEHVVIFRDCDFDRYATFGLRPRPMKEILTECASQLAYGNRICLYHVVEADGTIGKDKAVVAARASDFVRQRADYCVGNDSVANVALFASQADNLRLPDRYCASNKKLEVLHEISTMSHIASDLVHDDILARRLDRYDLIVLGEVNVLLPDTAAVISKFVESGGTVLVIGRAPVVDLPWAVEAGSPVFSGLDSQTGRPSAKHWESGEVIWLGALNVPTREYEPVWRVNDLNGTAGGPLLVRSRIGLGSLYWLLTDSLSEYGERIVDGKHLNVAHPYLRRFIGRALQCALGEHWQIRSDAAPGIEFVLNRRGDDLLVHAVNAVPGFEPEALDALLDEHPLLADIAFSVRLRRTPAAVRPLFENAAVIWKMENDVCHVQLDRLRIHEAVLFEGAYCNWVSVPGIMKETDAPDVSGFRGDQVRGAGPGQNPETSAKLNFRLRKKVFLKIALDNRQNIGDNTHV